MYSRSGIIIAALAALLVGGCATPSEPMRGNKDSPYENTDRLINPYENANRPILALDSGVGTYPPSRGRWKFTTLVLVL